MIEQQRVIAWAAVHGMSILGLVLLFTASLVLLIEERSRYARSADFPGTWLRSYVEVAVASAIAIALVVQGMNVIIAVCAWWKPAT